MKYVEKGYKEIIDEVIDSKIVEKTANKILKGDRDKEDLVQDIYLQILSISESKISNLYKNKELYFYILYIIKAIILSERGKNRSDYKRYVLGTEEDLSKKLTNDELFDFMSYD